MKGRSKPPNDPLRRYRCPNDPAHVFLPLHIHAEKPANLRERGAAPSVIWQDIRATIQRALTWTLSDTVRDQDAQDLLYHSRSRPDLTHLVIFDTSIIAETSTPQPWSPTL